MRRAALLTLTISLFFVSCSKPPASPERPPTTPTPAPSFINKVWKVRDSTAVAPGGLYVFLEEGTLVVTSAGNRPSFGSWKLENGALTMVEEGIAYPTDVLKLTATEFRIRSHNPGEPVEIGFVRADGG